MLGVPESPRWLAQKGRYDQATSTLSYVSTSQWIRYIAGKRDAILNAILLENACRPFPLGSAVHQRCY